MAVGIAIAAPRSRAAASDDAPVIDCSTRASHPGPSNLKYTFQIETTPPIDQALHGATDVPLEMMHICEEALRHGIVISRHSLASAKSDCAIGIELISVALRGAARAVDANLSRFQDEVYVARVTKQCRRFESDATETMSILRALDAV
jgi:hypothetical protein